MSMRGIDVLSYFILIHSFCKIKKLSTGVSDLSISRNSVLVLSGGKFRVLDLASSSKFSALSWNLIYAKQRRQGSL